jgi:hypothetical protein
MRTGPVRRQGRRRGGNNNEIFDHSRRGMFFSERIRSGCAQGRQQAAGLGKAERTDGLQTRRNGEGHQAVGW